MDKGPGIGEAVLGGRYTLLAQVKASIGGTKSYIGTKGQCRYCGATSARYFRTEAHAFPEGLGNHWVISRDECDKCNELFSKYDDAVVRAVGPFLTLGGVKGKANKVRQTGRSNGLAILARRDGQERPAISIHSTNAEPSEHMAITADGTLRLRMPVADDLFKPRYAYKALVKMAVAITMPRTSSRPAGQGAPQLPPVILPHLGFRDRIAHGTARAEPRLTRLVWRRRRMPSANRYVIAAKLRLNSCEISAPIDSSSESAPGTVVHCGEEWRPLPRRLAAISSSIARRSVSSIRWGASK
jgi:hypothetical protein